MEDVPEPSAPRVLMLPEGGDLIVCTDLHGNLRDFKRICQIFEERLEQRGDCFLLFTGDLIHGPNCTADDWPDYLGEHFEDQSPELLDRYVELERRYSGRVSCLLGNHEHSHVGGPHTPKFWPDETAYFEESVGPEKTELYQGLFRRFPVVALGRCGVAVTHAAPDVTISGPEEIDSLGYAGYENLPGTSWDEMPLLGRLLWSRRCMPETARRFLRALSRDAPLRLVVYGHEIVSSGYLRIGNEQLLLSTSFGLSNESKTYLQLDLGASYNGVDAIRERVELLPLWDPEG